MTDVVIVSGASARPNAAVRAWETVTAWIARHERAVFAAVVLINLVPVWAFTYLPTTDGAAHVANADVMRKIGDPSLDVLRKYYYVSKAPMPNLVGHLVLAGLMYVVKPVVAEKVLVSLYMVLFPVSVRYAVGSVRRAAWPLAFFALPLTYNYLFAQGFYNFCLSWAGFFFLVGYWVRHRDRLDGWRAAGLCAIAGGIYMCHLFSLMMACGVVGLLAVVEVVRNKPGAMGRLVVTGLALAPWVVLSLVFRPKVGVYPEVEYSLKDDIVGLIQFSSMVSFRNNEAWLGGALASLIVAVAGMALMVKVSRRAWRGWDVLLLMPIGLVAVYFKAHDAASWHFYIPQRCQLYAVLTLLVWLMGQPIARWVRLAVPPLAVGLALAFVAAHATKYREFAPQLREFISAGQAIDRNSTFLPLIFAPRGCTPAGRPSSIDVSPFYMASGYIAVSRDAVDLRNYEANTDHFPVRFREGLNPYTELAVGRLGLDRVPPEIDLAHFRVKGGEADYILLWGLSQEMREKPEAAGLFKQITDGYEKVEGVGGRWTELWERKGR